MNFFLLPLFLVLLANVKSSDLFKKEMVKKIINLPLSRFEEYIQLTNKNLLHLETLYYGKQKNGMAFILIKNLRK